MGSSYNFVPIFTRASKRRQTDLVGRAPDNGRMADVRAWVTLAPECTVVRNSMMLPEFNAGRSPSAGHPLALACRCASLSSTSRSVVNSTLGTVVVFPSRLMMASERPSGYSMTHDCA